MKYAFSLLILFAAISLTAQSSKLSMSETVSDDNYEFTVKVDKKRLPVLQKCFNELTGQPKTRTISGVATHEKDGLTIELNTWKRKITMYTDAVNDAAITEAKAKARLIKDKLKAPTPPKPPTDDWQK